jgi:hypothetical protein
MSLITRIALALLLATAQVPSAFALDDAPASVVQELVPFSSDEGLARLARSDAKVDFPVLANQFEAESNGAFCGPTSAAIVLNAVRGRSPDLPRDHSRLHPEDLQYIPSAYDPALPRFTQDNVISKGQKTRAQVLGEPVTIDGKKIQDFGYQVRQLDEMLRANGLTTRLTIVDDSKSEQDIRTELVEHLLPAQGGRPKGRRTHFSAWRLRRRLGFVSRPRRQSHQRRLGVDADRDPDKGHAHL